MGVCIYATHSTDEFYMGYGGFFNLRKNIAMILDNDFGENYANLIFCHTEAEYAENDKVANEIIANKKLDTDIIQFLYLSDTNGEIGYKVCKKIYDLIKDVDFGKKGFRYAAYQQNDYEDFKDFLKECYQHHRKMRWS